MDYWPWWLSGLVLAGVMVGHWIVLRRLMAVSGRFTAIVNWIRFPDERDDDAGDMTPEELRAAIAEATAEAFGADAVSEPPAPQADVPVPTLTRRQPLSAHILFIVGMGGGGLLSALLAGGWEPIATLRSVQFTQTFGDAGWVTPVVLVSGGLLVGFGTRMAGGCTTGHGLCGVSRFQTGSLLATAGFFATGAVTALVLWGLR